MTRPLRWLTAWGCVCVQQGVHWLMLTALALDQLSDTLLKAARRRVRAWRPVRCFWFDPKGRILRMTLQRKKG